MGRLPLPLVVTLAAAAPFRMAFKRLPKESPIDGARRAARVAAAHRQRAMLKDEHCLIDSINTTLKTTRDVLVPPLGKQLIRTAPVQYISRRFQGRIY